LELRAGDAFIFEDHLLTHSNEEVIGKRHSLVAFTYQSVLDWHNKRVKRRDRKKEKVMIERGAYQGENSKRKKQMESRSRKRARAVEVEGKVGSGRVR
jgi:hypothetical protein